MRAIGRMVESLVYVPFALGGPGSGHHDHEGLPDVWGGSSPGSGAGPVAGTVEARSIPDRINGLRLSGLLQRLRDEGGFSTTVKGVVPTHGYMVSPYKDREKSMPLRELNRRELARYVVENRDLLGEPEHYLGGWVDEDTVYLDVSIRASSRDAALQLAKDNGQLAVYCVHTQEVIEVA